MNRFRASAASHGSLRDPQPPRIVAMMLLAVCSVNTMADEGMWLFNNPPRKQLKEKYGFEVTDPWLEHV